MVRKNDGFFPSALVFNLHNVYIVCVFVCVCDGRVLHSCQSDLEKEREIDRERTIERERGGGLRKVVLCIRMPNNCIFPFELRCACG